MEERGGCSAEDLTALGYWCHAFRMLVELLLIQPPEGRGEWEVSLALLDLGFLGEGRMACVRKDAYRI